MSNMPSSTKPYTTTMPTSRPTFGGPQDAFAAGYFVTNYNGSWQQWRDGVVSAMIQAYIRGDQSMLDRMAGATGPIGQPNRDDFGSATGGNNGQVSTATRMFFERFVDMYWDSDPYIKEMFGNAPQRTDLQYERPWLTSDEQIKLAQQQMEKDWAIANLQAGTQLTIARERNATDIAIANMENMTRRYIAEGEWGVQREIAALAEMGRLTSFVMELGFRYDDLALRAQQERNRHHEAMVALVTEVAKYDAQLAAEPRNWIAYASWLQNKGMVVNQLTLGVAAQAIADSDIPQTVVSNSTAGQSLGGMISTYLGMIQQTYQRGLAGPAGGGSGGAGSAGGPNPNSDFTFTIPGTNISFDYTPPDKSAFSTETGVDYGQLLNEISPQKKFDLEQLQEAYAGVDASGGARDTSGYYAGPTTNALGMSVNPLGHKNRFSQFLNMSPAQQEMNVAAGSSVGKPEQDYLKEFTKATPRGKAGGVAQYG